MIVNFTQHTATQDQLDAGVIEPTVEQKARIVHALTFTTLPSVAELHGRTSVLATIMGSYEPDLAGEVKFMVGGAPYLMSALASWAPVYDMVFAFSERVSHEQVMPDGSVRKVNVFRHKGFVPMFFNMGGL
jgi:hypothetical protein